MSEAIIKTDKVEYRYKSHLEGHEGTLALKGITLEIPKGQFVVVLGRNGSGKSTLARLMNALQLPTEGTVYVKGMDTRDAGALWEIRRTAGMVFQNPDNQIIGTTVEEDVAFGPENLGVQPEKIRASVNSAIDMVGISEYMTHAPHLLSGGQKQRVAIAGILAMKPECIILDEATAMLDPIGRKEILQVVRKLNSEEGITVVQITHHMDEAVDADRVLVMQNGEIVMEGTPAQVFSNVKEMKESGLDVPQVTELFYEIKKNGYPMPDGILTVEQAFECLKGMLK